MKVSIKMALMGLTLVTSMQAMAAQESYGVPGPKTKSPVPGAPLAHQFSCTIPQKNGERLLGTGYSLECDTSAVHPKYNVRGCTLLSQAVVAHPKVQREFLKQTYQNESIAEFEGAYTKVTLRKSDFSAQIVFTDGATSDCKALN